MLPPPSPPFPFRQVRENSDRLSPCGPLPSPPLHTQVKVPDFFLPPCMTDRRPPVHPPLDGLTAARRGRRRWQCFFSLFLGGGWGENKPPPPTKTVPISLSLFPPLSLSSWCSAASCCCWQDGGGRGGFSLAPVAVCLSLWRKHHFLLPPSISLPAFCAGGDG